MKTTLPQISPELINKYKQEIGKNASVSTLKRKNVSLNKFLDFKEGKKNEDMIVGTAGVSRSKKVGLKTIAVLGFTSGLVILLVLFLGKLKLPIQFINNYAQESDIQTLPENTDSEIISAIPAGNGAWNLYAKLKLMDSTGSPRVGSESLTFKLYNTESGGSPLWTSNIQNITTDNSGSVLISLDGVPTELFFQNNNLFLEPETASASGQGSPLSVRIPVPTASDPGIPGVTSDGSLVLAGESPSIIGEDGNLLIEGQAVTIKTID
ncbi:MAG: hypothetical protein AAB622_02470, partial [Patescibacteria group bacterium]